MRRPPMPEQMQFAGTPRGPEALPGTYTIKLFVGDKVVQERKVEVRVDPTVSVTTADLQAQNDLALHLRDMLSSLNDSLRLLDSAKQQAEQIEKVAKEFPRDVKIVRSYVDSQRKELKKVSSKLLNSVKAAQAKASGVAKAKTTTKKAAAPRKTSKKAASRK